MFESLDQAVKEDKTLDDDLSVKKIFSSWSDSSGFPLLIVSRNYQQNSIKILQERYFDHYPHPEANLTSFWIPYNFDTSNNVAVNDTSTDGWLPKGIKSKLIKPNGNKNWTNSDWCLFNKQQTGFYRVLYDKRNYDLLLKELNSGDKNKIHPFSRAQLIDDHYDFVLTNRIPSEMYFNLIKYLKYETDIAPWNTAMSSFFQLKQSLTEGTDTYEKYIKFIANIVEPFYQSNNLKSSNFIGKSKQKIATNLACGFGIKSCLESTTQLLEKGIFTQDLRGTIYENGIRFASAEVIESIWKRLWILKNSEEIQEIINSFGNIANKELLKKYLYKSFDTNINLKNEVRLAMFYSIATKSNFGLSLALDLLKSELNKRCMVKNEGIGCKQLELKKSVPLLAKYINNDHSKSQVSIKLFLKKL